MFSALENRVAIRFLAVTVILIAANVASFVSVAQFLEIWGRVEHTHGVVKDLKDVVSLLQDAESGQRGFLLTNGKEEYLQPYMDAINDVQQKLGELRTGTRQHSLEEQRTLEELEHLIERKLAEVGQTIVLQRAGNHEAALRLVNTDRGQRVMNEIRAGARKIESSENERLATFVAEGQEGRDWMIAIRVGGFVLVLIVLAAVYRLVKHEMAERRVSEEAQARLVALLEATSDFVGIADMSGRALYVSRAGREMAGKSEESISRSVIADYFPEWAYKIIMSEAIPTAIRHGMWTGESAMLHRDGGETPVWQVVLSHKDSLGRVQYVSTIARDITERKCAEAAIKRSHDELEERVLERTAELERTNLALQAEVAERLKAVEEARRACDAAEMATRAKGEFLANMSHEIRTPMNGVLGMLDLVLRSGLPRRQQEFLTLAKNSADTLLRLLNDILDFSKIEAGRLDLESTAFNIDETLGDCLKSHAIHVHEKGLELSCSIAQDVPKNLIGDPGRLSQIVGNLIGNAKKFTERGEVVVRVEVKNRDDEGVLLHVSVRDTGIGIPDDKQRLIFEAFTQADASTTRQFGGTGLGLAICSHLIESMGGRIWLESQVGEGSEFHFTARFGVHEGALGKATTPGVDLEGLPVLVVDDNATQCCILEELLSAWGMRATIAHSGPAAITAMKQARESGEPFALVLLDVVMPDMDGFEVAEWIQRDSELAGTAVMMLSSADFRGDSERCLRLGISVFLRKPIKASELLESILDVLGTAAATPREHAATDSPSLSEPSRRLQILLAEDTPVNQRLAVSLLEERGHSVVVANDGQEALDLIGTRAFDLVLMDVQMPRLDGFQATATIRAREKCGNGRIPIIAMTAHAMKGDRERCLAGGMDGYISKPIRAEQFLSTVENWPLSPSEWKQVEADQNSSSEGPPEHLSSAPVFDLDRAMTRVRGKRSLLSKLGELFLADSPVLLGEIDAAVLAGDGEALERSAHRLRGSAGSLCAPRVAEIAQHLEKMGRDRDLTRADPARRNLESELVCFESAIRDWMKGEE